ncbi:MAG: HNH endonuclease signature motif containing protein, partial [Streptosporangiaceae bacterium]
KRQRDHDALEEACRRLIAAGGLPGRAGQPTQIRLHLTLDDQQNQHGAAGSGPDGSGPDGTGPGSALSPGPARPQDSGTDAGRAAWRSWWPGSAPAGPGADCDATIMPIVTGRVDTQSLDRLAAQLLRRDPGTRNSAAGRPHPSQPGRDQPGQDRDAAGRDRPERDRDERARRAARDLAVSRAVALLSGPGGLAAFLRTGHPSDLISPPSLPLDVGTPTPVIPPHLRRAVTARDRHCRFPGCDQPPAACQPHHLIPRADGGTTSLGNLLLLCSFHHLIAIHRWSWAITLHSDGNVTATSPDRTRTLRSHDPPTSTAA